MRSAFVKIRNGMAVILLLLVLTACSETELEERCFPMMAAVGFDDGSVEYMLGFPDANSAGDAQAAIGKIQVAPANGVDFQESKKSYESRLNKLADYNHLKVIALEEDFLQEKTAYYEMLDYLASQEVFPRNTYVCMVDDLDELFESEKNLPQDLGTYLEEFLNQREIYRSKRLTIGDLIDERENQTLELYLPYLEVEENYVHLKGYVNINGKTW